MVLKVQSLRELTREELIQRRAELLDEQFNLKMRKALKSLDNPLRLRTVRRELARIETVLREDDLGLHKLADQSASILPQSVQKDKKASK